MPYDSIINSAALSDAMNAPENSTEIFQNAVENSALMSLARRLPNMGTGTRNITVLDSLPLAYFVGANTESGAPGFKQTTDQGWKGKVLTAEELAVIVPFSESVLADSAVDLEAQVIPRIGEAMGRLVDSVCLSGSGLPATWMTTTAGVSRGIAPGAVAAGNAVALGTGADLYDDLANEEGVWAAVEGDGYTVTGSLMHPVMMGRLRGVRDGSTGVPIFGRTLDGNYSLMNERTLIARNGSMAAEYPLIAGDWSQVVWAIRQDITVKLLSEGVIQDAEGEIVHNLAQQDMVALRVVFRLGVQIANPVTSLSTSESTRYPFAVLTNIAS